MNISRKRGEKNAKRRSVRAKTRREREKQVYLSRQRRLMNTEGTQHGDPISIRRIEDGKIV